MLFEVVQSSPKAEAMIKSREDALGIVTQRHALAKYPYDQLHIGQSFIVQLDGEVNEGSVRLGASQRSKKTGKKFSVLKHAESPYGRCLEIARIA